MKKLLVGMIAAFMMAASLVAVTGGSASAIPARCGYTACIPTDSQIRAFSPKPRKLRAIAGVSAGNIRVNRGRIKIQVKGNDKYRQSVGTAPKHKKTFRLPPGIYLVQAKYIPGQSRFRRSAESTIVTVKSRRRR